MPLRIGIDVGGTFTDFLVTEDSGEMGVFKVLSTPKDPSIGLMNGMAEIACARGKTLEEFMPTVDTIVHGTTITTNAVLTGSGAKTALITTRGVRDALEMRRGIREERYNNRFTNVKPLVSRCLRWPVGERMDYKGDVLHPVPVKEVKEGLKLFRREEVEALAICFMNAFANPVHEARVAEMVDKALPQAYLSVSTRVLPAVRFYDRVSTTVLNSYVGPVLRSYLRSLTMRLREVGFKGVLLIMQSNGGVVSPEVAIDLAAATLLSGPAAGPAAGVAYAGINGHKDCITIDMGGTSFDAALVRGGLTETITEGEVSRYRIALPMLGIVTIGAGGGSIAWMDEGGLLRMGPQSAGAEPGPVCYDRGGVQPTCTDADLILGYLDPDFFAGGRIKLNKAKAEKAIEERIAKRMGLPLLEAAAGMYRVINTNMAHGVREVTIKRGFDPREFPMVVAGGAGPIHSCMIARELEMPLTLVPRESSVFCATGMLMSDLKHDFVRSYITRWDRLSPERLLSLLHELRDEGRRVLKAEHIPEERMRFLPSLDMRYVKQYHEVNCPIVMEEVEQKRFDVIAERFHREHNRLFGYSLEEEKTVIELINVRMRAIGDTEKPRLAGEELAGEDPSHAFKRERPAFIPESGKFENVPVFDAHRLRHGNRVTGPALLEQANTTIFVSADFDMSCDPCGSYVVYAKGKEDMLSRMPSR